MDIVRKAEPTPSPRRARDWDPFETMRELLTWDRFQEMVPRLWRGGEERVTWMPSFDVVELKEGFLFKADLPGVKEQDVEINVTGNRLAVSGKREAEKVEETDTWYCSERSYGSFLRTFTLPEGIDVDHVRAELKEGILSIHVPKKVEAQSRRISVGGAATEKKVKA